MVLAEWAFHRVKAFSASQTAPPGSGLGENKILGGVKARTADPSCPKGYPRPDDDVLSNISWGKKEERLRVKVSDI